MLDTHLLVIIGVISLTVVLLIILAIFCITKKLFKNRNFSLLNDTENSNELNKNLLTPIVKQTVVNERSAPKTPQMRPMHKFLSVSLSEIPFIDDAYISVPDLRISKTCDVICSWFEAIFNSKNITQLLNTKQIKENLHMELETLSLSLYLSISLTNEINSHYRN